jgi:hypothetical protein
MIHFWNDTNQDVEYQNGETGPLFGTTGGKHHFPQQDLSHPLKKRLLLTLATPLSKKWSFHLKGIYKKFARNLAIRFQEEYGSYENIDGADIYFFDRPFGDYYLSNPVFEEDPFYAQLLLRVSGEERRHWYFSFSFLAHIGMGVTAFGNGPGSNDIGIIHESQANPNSWIKGFGRVDGDRAFVAKCYAGFFITRNLSLGISVKYRDGNPFAFFDSLNKHGQWVITYQTIQAENKKGEKGGPREDYMGDISLKLSYNFRLFGKKSRLSLSVFNILDVGYELSEYVFADDIRDAMELNIPRSARLTWSIAL